METRCEFEDYPFLVGAGREPIWPSGVTGSITHCRGLCAAAAASSDEVSSIGLDAEENLTLPQGVLEVVLSSRDQGLQSELPNSIVCSDRLLFCVKESGFQTRSLGVLAAMCFQEISKPKSIGSKPLVEFHETHFKAVLLLIATI